jgi:N utilization substance protein A
MPVRTCAGCGRKAPQAELIRFGAIDGQLTPGRLVPGRGVYTCPRLACFERAASRNAFSRVLRRTVRVEPELAALYTGS